MPVNLEINLIRSWDGNCDECGEPADKDASTVTLRVNGRDPLMHFHQVCAWKRATFIFGELF